ncbi:tetratricopeptide repeat protein [Reyranella sp.]|uniref:tetratricopeptide repeat protein n=1 Tax=Reyranella sp. TaxID=1929291 RepID=UPI003D107002
MSDSAAFQEVDDAVRQDDMKLWWKRWGTWVVGGAVVAVVAVTGMVGYRQYDSAQRAAASAAYSAALAKIGQDNAAARAELNRQAGSAPAPYDSLAALAAAQLLDKPEEQVAALEAVSAKLPPELSDLALVIAGYRSVDAGKLDTVVARLDPLAMPDRPFHASVTELKALAAARKNDLKRARELWTAIVKDPASPQGEQQRAQAMLSYYGPGEGK